MERKTIFLRVSHSVVLQKCEDSVALWNHGCKTSELCCDMCVRCLNQEHMVKVTPEGRGKNLGSLLPFMSYLEQLENKSVYVRPRRRPGENGIGGVCFAQLYIQVLWLDQVPPSINSPFIHLSSTIFII
jgi:hypothetical protein